VITRRLLELSEARVNEAQRKAQLVHSGAAVPGTLDDEDLEGGSFESPESLMLRTVSQSDIKDRTDREIVTPWLKFLWESYRTVLDVLKNNTKVT
jgi:translation initiation factor 3 subunit A